MSNAGSGGGDKPRDYDVSEGNPAARDVVDAEPDDDEEIKRRRDAALASTYDPQFAHSGKTDEEMIEERQDEARMLLDVAIVTGAVLAVHELAERDNDSEEAAEADAEEDEADVADDTGDASE
ncbi:MAG: hypothetical protein R3C16_10830 [Hyphomonadaceae bacterium]